MKDLAQECEEMSIKAEAHAGAMTFLAEAAKSWGNADQTEIGTGLTKLQTARELLMHCGEFGNMQWIVYAVEMQLLRSMKEIWEEEDGKKRNTGGNVYFLQSQETGLIKIGFSKQPKVRTKNLMVSHQEETKTIGFIPGTQKTESSIHKAFSKNHKRGEWFSPSKELVGFIESFSSPAASVGVSAVVSPTLMLPLAGSAKQIEARA